MTRWQLAVTYSPKTFRFRLSCDDLEAKGVDFAKLAPPTTYTVNSTRDVRPVQSLAYLPVLCKTGLLQSWYLSAKPGSVLQIAFTCADIANRGFCATLYTQTDDCPTADLPTAARVNYLDRHNIVCPDGTWLSSW